MEKENLYSKVAKIIQKPYFKDLSEKDKINLIKAYLRFYLCVNMEIETYKIHY